ncbi:hypothetical protein NBRC116594_08680 [Shimia sp. NS0008-38b]|uniref:hypothetical protein n=1 Tax=Shimia sp. NS0008-38b TaxID=3127653 RepID=UPI00310ACC0A
MFNLIVSGRVDHDRKGSIDAGRVLQYTDGAIQAKFQPDGVLDIDAVLSLPTIVMEEGRGDERIRIVNLSRVVKNGTDYDLTYTVDPDLPKLTNADIDALSKEFHLDDWELGTNHWAIKDVDLFQVLLSRQTEQQPKPSVFEISEKPKNPILVSFMMPFTGPFTSVYQDLRGVLEADGYECQRADDMWENAHIMTDIIELICTSAVIVCDLSTKNPNVFYEAGIAHTLGKQVILITQSHDDVPFDLRTIRYLQYLNNGEGRAKLAAEVLARVKSVT